MDKNLRPVAAAAAPAAAYEPVQKHKVTPGIPGWLNDEMMKIHRWWLEQQNIWKTKNHLQTWLSYCHPCVSAHNVLTMSWGPGRRWWSELGTVTSGCPQQTPAHWGTPAETSTAASGGPSRNCDELCDESRIAGMVFSFRKNWIPSNGKVMILD